MPHTPWNSGRSRQITHTMLANSAPTFSPSSSVAPPMHCGIPPPAPNAAPNAAAAATAATMAAPPVAESHHAERAAALLQLQQQQQQQQQQYKSDEDISAWRHMAMLLAQQNALISSRSVQDSERSPSQRETEETPDNLERKSNGTKQNRCRRSNSRHTQRCSNRGGGDRFHHGRRRFRRRLKSENTFLSDTNTDTDLEEDESDDEFENTEKRPVEHLHGGDALFAQWIPTHVYAPPRNNNVNYDVAPGRHHRAQASSIATPVRMAQHSSSSAHSDPKSDHSGPMLPPPTHPPHLLPPSARQCTKQYRQKNNVAHILFYVLMILFSILLLVNLSLSIHSLVRANSSTTSSGDSGGASFAPRSDKNRYESSSLPPSAVTFSQQVTPPPRAPYSYSY